MKKLASKLNNFKITAIVVSIIQIIGILAAIGGLVSYTFAGGVVDKLTVPALNYVKGHPERQIWGMVFFLSCIFAIAVSILVVYNLFPNILNKEKVNTKKGFVIAGMADSVLHMVIIAFTVLILVVDEPQTKVGFIASLAGSGLFIALNLFMIYPLVRCEFYQPEIIVK